MGELLWIDSVCIDQTNSAEVNSQVALMGHIYSSCQLTIAWLASDDEYLMAGVTRIQMIRDVAKPHVPAEWKFIIEEALLNSPINGNFQEIGLPNFTEDLPISLYVLLTYTIIEITDARMASGKNTGLQWLNERNRSVVPSPFEALTRFRIFEATNAKDKVYAFLGFAALQTVQGGKNIGAMAPDYSKAIHETYRDASWNPLPGTESLSILSAVQDRSLSKKSCLPSWVPDFIVNLLAWSLGNATRGHLAATEKFKPNKKRIPCFLFWKGRKSILLTGSASSQKRETC